MSNSVTPRICVWVDDLRNPDDFGHPYCTWCKTSQDFKNLVADFGEYFFEIHLDNDLGEDSEEGYDLFCFIEEKMYTEGLFKNLKTIYVHTANPSAGSKFVSAAVGMYGKFKINVKRVNYI